MKPSQLIQGLSDLADSLPVTACAFKVPTAPWQQPNDYRTEVTARDIKDMLAYIRQLEAAVDNYAPLCPELYEARALGQI